MRYFIHLAYQGAPFYGWQTQPNNPTVQETIEQAISLLLKEKITITGCGRTDTGVNAKNYYAHFNTTLTLKTSQLEHLVLRLNSFLPAAIVIYRIFQVDENTHARFDAVARTYRYYIALHKNPFNTFFTLRIFEKLDIDKMNSVAQLLLNNTDFTSFSKVNTQVNNFICHISVAEWKWENDLLVFEITADRFLRNMVRAIVGTLLDVGKGKMEISEFQEIINQKNRSKAGTSVPAHALFLEQIKYPFL
ncbi:MAG: tRNA pseudouridine(38-40) synthase TruA [Bacteroidales bacterium]|jgi:tRNA pseudouridine38-40 synthase|nr:tRNA pseudouridine(38-40) synthase TruA [Bacteroidales bacterium]